MGPRYRLPFKQGDRAVRSISEPGLKGARLTRSRGGTSTTVVYTDIELSRKLLDHYGAARNASDMTVFDDGNAVDIPASFPNPQVSDVWSMSHGVPTSVNAVDGNPDDNDPADSTTTLKDDLPADAETPREKDSYPGRLHGLNGDFVCIGDGCQVQVTPSYSTTLADGKFALSSVAVAATGGTLHFKPDRGVALQLYQGGPVGADAEYMVFGYWWDEPASALGDYEFGVFADTVGGAHDLSGVTGSAEYDGTAVGMYVEQGALGTSGVSTRQGEFTADVRLDVEFGNTTTISGTIDGFETTPTGGSAAPTTQATWEVDLNYDGTDHTAAIDIRGTTSSGIWSHAFVDHHDHDTLNAQPPAVTGTFNTRIPNLLHIVGAFGAHKQ